MSIDVNANFATVLRSLDESIEDFTRSLDPVREMFTLARELGVLPADDESRDRLVRLAGALRAAARCVDELHDLVPPRVLPGEHDDDARTC